MSSISKQQNVDKTTLMETDLYFSIHSEHEEWGL